jgi:prevent-host-death family protein
VPGGKPADPDRHLETSAAGQASQDVRLNVHFTDAQRYSIAQARANLSAIVDEVESGTSNELTRRGTSVAFMVSVDEYQRLLRQHVQFKDAYQRFLTTHDLTKVGVDRKFSATLRDRTVGRKVRL